MNKIALFTLPLLLAAGCTQTTVPEPAPEKRVIYAPVKLTSDLSHLNSDQHKMLGLLIEASDIMDHLFWLQAFGEPKPFLDSIADADLKQFADYNYGPWDRLANEKPFIDGYGEKPLGARFYPADMTRDEFEAWPAAGKKGLYSLVRRNSQGELTLLPYSKAYAEELARAAKLLREAADLAVDPEFANYLRLRADAFLSDVYRASDMAWMDMKNNPIDVVIGPIENYEDRLYGYRTAFESYVLVKDQQWSERLSRFASYLPQLQKNLPVPAKYKQDEVGTDSDLNAYDVIYYAGHSNAGSKTIAINLPNDEEVQLAKGTRRLQLKNAMRAKFDKTLIPISQVLIAPEQRQYITFDAFFENTMFHEVAHGLGIKKTITTGEYVRTAMKDTASALEEGKADILGLYMISELAKLGEMDAAKLDDNYVTFLAGIFRSVRFGASSAHGKANMVRFNFFQEKGAFHRDAATGQYRVNRGKMQTAMAELSELLLTLQGNGDYDGAVKLLADYGHISPQLQADLDRLAAANIPVDITFEQGKKALGLK